MSKEIKIDPSFFGYNTSKRKTSKNDEKKKRDMLVNVNGKSVKDLLLQKLKDYKKNKENIKTRKFNSFVDNSQKQINPDFLEKLKRRKQRTENNIDLTQHSNFDHSQILNRPSSYKTISFQSNEPLNSNVVGNYTNPHNNLNNNDFYNNNNNISNSNFSNNDYTHNSYHSNNNNNSNHGHIYNSRNSISKPFQQNEIPMNVPKYGNLKNGLLPTFRTMKNKTMKNVVHHVKPVPHEQRIKLEIEKKLKVGKNKTQKKVGVFIKNNQLRTKVEDEKLKMKKTPIRTVKSYLKDNNLIKYGSSAPNELLRIMYESSNLLCGVTNKNSKNIIHNYLNNE